MSILDVTEDQIFHTLGKGRDPNFKPIEKARPAIIQPKKTYVNTTKPVQITQPVEPIKLVSSPEVEESVKKLSEELTELNHCVSGIKTLVKWYVVPQFLIVLVLLALLLKDYLL